eukprot:GHVQ01014991.1.p1 GENE.GHVQ01014991.1~~GHVQ01014991.1.p1  ORF type:complete len:123 (-),score=16.55 GHVQ01014991.1:1129-1497(-)
MSHVIHFHMGSFLRSLLIEKRRSAAILGEKIEEIGISFVLDIRLEDIRRKSEMLDKQLATEQQREKQLSDELSCLVLSRDTLKQQTKDLQKKKSQRDSELQSLESEEVYTPTLYQTFYSHLI